MAISAKEIIIISAKELLNSSVIRSNAGQEVLAYGPSKVVLERFNIFATEAKASQDTTSKLLSFTPEMYFLFY